MNILDVEVEKFKQNSNRDDRTDGQNCRVVGPGLTLHKPVTAHDHRADGAYCAGLIDGGNTENNRTQNDQYQCQRRHQRQQYLDDKLVVEFSFKGHRRGVFWFDQRRDQYVEHIDPDQDHARDKGAHEHVAGTRGNHIEIARHGKFPGRQFVVGLACGSGLISRTG